MKLCRLILIVAVLAFAYGLGLVTVILWPWSAIYLLAVVVQGLRRGAKLWACGTARFAEERDLRRMKHGFSIGLLVKGKKNLLDHWWGLLGAGWTLLNPGVEDREACESFWRAAKWK
jgi:hypothetical protein